MPLAIIFLLSILRSWATSPRKNVFIHLVTKHIFVHDDLENAILADEVLKCIKKIKYNKSYGYDGILNEFLKTSSSKLLVAVTTLFNIVLQAGKISHA